MSTGIRPAALYGGPLDGQTGEVVALPLPDVLEMGENGAFIYRIAGTDTAGRVRFQYDAPSTRKRLHDLGVHPDLLAQADDRHVSGLLAAGATLDPGEGSAFAVEVKRYADRWECWVDGVLVEQQPRAAFGDDDRDGLKHWTEEVVHALAQEATRR